MNLAVFDIDKLSGQGFELIEGICLHELHKDLCLHRLAKDIYGMFRG
jgi:hypothetical protein